MTELSEAVASWTSLLLVVVVFGFAPGFCLRLIILAYPRGDPRRAELIAELYAVPRIQRPLWVAEQLEVALFEGLAHRVSATLRRQSVLGPITGAAAVVVIAFSGVGLFAKSAEPGDQLFALTKVLYADYARSVETALQVRTELEQIDQALAEGKTSPAQARESLERVEDQLAVVDEAQGRTEQATKRDQLADKLDGMTPPVEVP